MADILTIDDARAALRTGPADTSHDADLTGTYIPATTALVEGIVGPVMARTGVTQTFDGGASVLVLGLAGVTEVTGITVGGVTLDPARYVVDLPSSIVRTAYGSPRFTEGVGNVVVTYSAGLAETPEDVPPAIKLAARIILAHMWQVDQQGFRPDFNGVDASTTTVGVGYMVPNRAAELLAPFITDVGVA